MYKIRTWSVFLFLLFLNLSLSTNVIKTLPELKVKEHTFPSENFTVHHKEHFVYSFNTFENPSVQVTITKQGKQTHSNCQFQPQSLHIRQIQRFDFTSTTLQGMNFDDSLIAVSHHQKLVYFLSPTMKITALSYNQTHLTRLASATIKQNISSLSPTLSHDTAMVASEDGMYVFIFSSYGIWRIDCKGVLSNIERFNYSRHFDEFSFGVNEAIVWRELVLVSTEIGIFAYHLDVSGRLNLVSHVQKLNEKFPEFRSVGLAIDKNNGLVFVLDQFENIYIFKIDEGRLLSYDLIEFNLGVNFKVRVSGHHILFGFTKNDNFEICELYYDATSKQSELVRYYKLFEFVTDFFVMDESVLVFSPDNLDWLPIGIDPRLIQRQHNGVRTQSDVKSAVRISDSLYLLSSGKSLSLSWVTLRPPQLECNFDKSHSDITIKTTTNFSSCEFPEVYQQTRTKTRYNYYCEAQKTLYLSIDIPQKHERQKILLYGIISLFAVTILLGIFCLLQWRNNRIKTIDWFNDQIRKYQQSKMMAHTALNEQAPDQLSARAEDPQVIALEDNQENQEAQPPTSTNDNL